MMSAMTRKLSWGATLAVALAWTMTAEPARALEPLDFVFDPEATGDENCGGSCTVANGGVGDFFSFTLFANVDQVGGVFSEFGAGFVTAIPAPLPTVNPNIISSDLGFGNEYQLYVTFEAVGSVVGTTVGTDPAADATLTSLKAELWLDPGADTAFSIGDANVGGSSPGDTLGDQDGFSGLRDDAGVNFNDTGMSGPGGDGAAFTFSSTTDDIIIGKATGTIVSSDILIISVNPFGTFDVTFEIDTDYLDDGDTSNDVITFPTAESDILFAFLQGNVANLRGFDFGGGDFVDAFFNGTDLSFLQAPEPGTLAMLGTGLVVLGAAMRRRRQKKA